MPITQAKLKSMLSYDPESGDFHWTAGATHASRIGKKAGSKWKSCPYLFIEINGKRYRAHRLAWLYMTGTWPKKLIDHEDTNQINNRWKNLREATNSQNGANSRPWKRKTLPKGVYQYRDGRFAAQIKKDRKHHFLGYFLTPDEAHAAYVAAAERLHGKFARAA